MNQKPALLLLPNLLGDSKHHEPFLPASVDKAAASLDGLIAESAREGRRYLKRFQTKKPPAEIPIALFNEHTPEDELDFLLEPIKKGERWGLISDAGLPCIADPGYKLVRRAKETGIYIQAFIGPSSILLALMQSGLPAQQFNFRGYPEKDPTKRRRQILEVCGLAKKEKSTQIFIEAPHRNKHLLEALLELLPETARLCVGWDLTMPDQGLLSQQVQHWKKSPLPNLEKKPAIFLFSLE